MDWWHELLLKLENLDSTCGSLATASAASHQIFQSPCPVRRSVLLRDIIITWKEVRKTFSLPFLLFKHMPLWGHPESPYETSQPKNGTFQDKGIRLSRHLIHPEEKRGLMLQEVIEQYSLPKYCYFKSMQLLTFCRSRLKDFSVEEANPSFDEMASISPGRYGVSAL